jgi:hypothetical protein
MMIALLIVAAVLATLLYTAWLNQLFLRCPHCRKIGSWRFDRVEAAVVSKDEDGVVQSSREVRACRKCGTRVVDTWSDHGGRTLKQTANEHEQR